MAKLEELKRLAYSEQGMEHGELVQALLAVAEAAENLLNTYEIQFYVSHEPVLGGHIGYCSRTLNAKLNALAQVTSSEVAS